MPPCVLISSTRNSRAAGGIMPLLGGSVCHGTRSRVVFRLAIVRSTVRVIGPLGRQSKAEHECFVCGAQGTPTRMPLAPGAEVVARPFVALLHRSAEVGPNLHSEVCKQART